MAQPYERIIDGCQRVQSGVTSASFTLIGIRRGKNAEAWHNYIEDHQMQWPQYLDQDLKMAHLFQARGVPDFFLIDKNRFSVYHKAGWEIQWREWLKE